MTDVETTPCPAWQTADLADEWVEETSRGGDESNVTFGTGSISLTAPLSTEIRTNASNMSPFDVSTRPSGTFIVREDVPAAPLLQKAPGIPNKKGLMNDFFSPLPLERMFAPPSPPAVPLRSSASSDSDPKRDATRKVLLNRSWRSTPNGPSVPVFDGHEPKLDCQFTFTVPRRDVQDGDSDENCPLAQSTPGQPSRGHSYTKPPLTDSRLRLFQFQYDTFTREHLSAIVDSIAINTPSCSSATGSSGNRGSRLPRVSVTGTSPSRLRSAKRVKLNPSNDFTGQGAGAGATISRPISVRKDYVGESQSLMKKIKEARDFSTVTTVVSSSSPDMRANSLRRSRPKPQQTTPDAHMLSSLGVPGHGMPLSTPSAGTSSTMASRPHSSSSYQFQAAVLMEQIKSDMRDSKRLFSGETAVSHSTPISDKPLSMPPSPDAQHPPPLPDAEETVRANLRTSSDLTPMSIKARQKASPRKLLRRLSAADEVDRELADSVSNMSVEDNLNIPVPAIHVNFASSSHTSLTAPPSKSRPSRTSPVRTATGECLNRYASSSTASGTTHTSSVPSLVKHTGPGQMRRISPSDVPALPERVGRMVFDKVVRKWVRAPNVANAERTEGHKEHGSGTEGTSDDPFRDIESLSVEDSAPRTMGGQRRDSVEPAEDNQMDGGMTHMAEGTENSDVDEEEAELNSFSFDGPSTMGANGMVGGGLDNDETTDSEDEAETEVVPETTADQHQDDELDSDEDSPLDAELEPEPMPTMPMIFPVTTPLLTVNSTPARDLKAVATPTIRSALKGVGATPASVLKDPDRHRRQTPRNKSDYHRRRSVSFSDGKRDGPIRGLRRTNKAGDESDVEAGSRAESSSHFVPSVRSKRIADMLLNLEDSAFDHNISPTKTNSSGQPDELPNLANRLPFASVKVTPGSSRGARSLRPFSRSPSRKHSQETSGRANVDVTFLTECSFGVAHGRLVEVITDVQPFEPYWGDLTTIDLSGRKIESVARLEEFLPRLDSLYLDSNQLSWLSGIPATVRTLSVASNSLSSITSYSHLNNLQHLDISHNDLDSLRQLECLRHLKELRADWNKITSMDGLQRIDGLVKLSVQGNRIRVANLEQYRWARLEILNLRQNRLSTLSGLTSLSSLIALNIDENSVEELDASGPMPKLRILRASRNRLQELDLGFFPNLRTLYLDNNALRSLGKLERLTKLENLSLRNQIDQALAVLSRDVRDVKRLYLSGNPLKGGFLREACYSLLYLEIAACRLTSLPEGLGQLAPNLRVLNLNYNFLEDVRGLEGLTRLRKLTIIGSRLQSTKPLVRALQRLPELEMVDCRMNPCTLGWYLPLLIKDMPGGLEGKRGEKRERGWQDLDSKFRRDLPDEPYLGRLAYRGLVMRACSRIRVIDGVEVSEKERAKADDLLLGILGKNRIKR